MKELKGVITNWSLYGSRIHGMAIENGSDEAIITSTVVQITNVTGTNVKRCETQNSIYILV